MRCLRASYDDDNGTLGSQPLCSAESGRVQPGFLPLDRGWLRRHGADQTPRSRLERLLPAEPTVKRLRERGKWHAASAMSMQRSCVQNQASRATWRTSLAQPPPRNCKSRHPTKSVWTCIPVTVAMRQADCSEAGWQAGCCCAARAFYDGPTLRHAGPVARRCTAAAAHPPPAACHQSAVPVLELGSRGAGAGAAAAGQQVAVEGWRQHAHASSDTCITYCFS